MGMQSVVGVKDVLMETPMGALVGGSVRTLTGGRGGGGGLGGEGGGGGGGQLGFMRWGGSGP